MAEPGTLMATVCPACNADIDGRHTAIAQAHGNQLYFFCSAACLRLFLTDPEGFLAGKREPRPSGDVRDAFGTDEQDE